MSVTVHCSQLAGGISGFDGVVPVGPMPLPAGLVSCVWLSSGAEGDLLSSAAPQTRMWMVTELRVCAP